MHYLGYVEDGESVEMIMKKFEALEQIEKEIVTDHGKQLFFEFVTILKIVGKETKEENIPALSEDMMEKLFQQTSVFSVDNVVQESTLPKDPNTIVMYEHENPAEYEEMFFATEEE